MSHTGLEKVSSFYKKQRWWAYFLGSYLSLHEARGYTPEINMATSAVLTYAEMIVQGL